LYFVESTNAATGKRLFNVVLSGKTVLTTTIDSPMRGGEYIAVRHAFMTTTNSNGAVVIQFVTGSAGSVLVNGVAAFSVTPTTCAGPYASSPTSL
jgi:hypothetical protein